jgi:hypothetical protein
VTTPGDDASDDLVPVSVRLGTVVPPEDPEDWTRPLTWVAAAGMLAAPLLAAGWFWLARPATADAPSIGTWLLAAAVAGGGAAVGGTQIGRLRAAAGGLAAALFAGVVVVLVGAALAGERQVEAASPTLAHALAGAAAGAVGALAAAPLAAGLALLPSRGLRVAAGAALGVAVAALTVPRLFAG